MTNTPKRPRDTNQLAKLIADIATGEVEDIKTNDGKNAAAVALGLKGGAIRAKGPDRRGTVSDREASRGHSLEN